MFKRLNDRCALCTVIRVLYSMTENGRLQRSLAAPRTDAWVAVSILNSNARKPTISRSLTKLKMGRGSRALTQASTNPGRSLKMSRWITLLSFR
jgi:hypothetical protein